MEDNAVKVGTVNDDIREHIERYSNDFFELSLGFPGVKKYALRVKGATPSDSLMVLISQRDCIVRTPDGDSYNIMITVMGKDKKKAKDILEDFEKKMPFVLREGSEYIKQSSQFFFKLVESVF